MEASRLLCSTPTALIHWLPLDWSSRLLIVAQGEGGQEDWGARLLGEFQERRRGELRAAADASSATSAASNDVMRVSSSVSAGGGASLVAGGASTGGAAGAASWLSAEMASASEL